MRQAQGDTVTPVILSVSAVLGNIVLTAVFVQGLGLGVVGAGAATVLGNIAITPVCLYLLISPRQALFLTRRTLKVRLPVLARLTRVAAPAAFSQALSSLGFLVLQTVILSYGAEVAAAFSIGNKISNILLMPVLALGSVLAAYVGQNIGAGSGDRARRAYVVSRNLGFLIAVAGSLILLPFRETLVELLSNDPATQAQAVVYMFWVLLTQPLMALFQNYLGVFNGSGRTMYAFLMSTCRLWAIRLPLIMAFRSLTSLGASGVWYAMNISNFLILILGALLFRHVSFAPCSVVAAAEREEARTGVSST